MGIFVLLGRCFNKKIYLILFPLTTWRECMHIVLLLGIFVRISCKYSSTSIIRLFWKLYMSESLRIHAQEKYERFLKNEQKMTVNRNYFRTILKVNRKRPVNKKLFLNNFLQNEHNMYLNKNYFWTILKVNEKASEWNGIWTILKSEQKKERRGSSLLLCQTRVQRQVAQVSKGRFQMRVLLLFLP